MTQDHTPPPAPSEDAALVLFSGGQDSTTCLAWALARYPHVETLGFAYGQRHAIELDCRAPIRAALAATPNGPRLGPDHLIDLTATIAGIGATALTSQAEITIGQGNLPTTFVPGRNLLFLAAAAALAWRRGLRRLVAGMCETDFSGYPDCRDDTIKAMQLAANLGLDSRFVIETPLMWLDKAETFALADALGILEIVREQTHTCYRGDHSRRHDWGYGCGACPACELRAAGYRKWRGG